MVQCCRLVVALVVVVKQVLLGICRVNFFPCFSSQRISTNMEVVQVVVLLAVVVVDFVAARMLAVVRNYA